MPIPVPRFLSALILLLTTYATAQQGLRPLITRPIDDNAVVTLRGNTHPLAKPLFDMGIAPPDLPMDRMMLVLKQDPQQDFAVRKLLDDQQDKNSPNYHKWLTPSQFGAQFGASGQDIQLITGWLQAHGFQLNRVSNGRTVIEFSGVESQVEQAFHTQIHQYLVNGQQHWANATDPQIPAALAPAVAGVWSMHDFRKKSNLVMDKSAHQGSSSPAPLFTSTTGKHALMPGDFATIYNINPLYAQGINGQGTTIAIVGRTDLNLGDVYSFWSQAGFNPFFHVIWNGPDPGILSPGEQFEATLDVTWSGAVARGANLVFVNSASTNTTDGVDLSELYIIDNNVGDVMTESFGLCEAFFTSAEAQGVSALAEQAAAEGITYMVSSGDNGAEGCIDPNANSANNAPLGVNMLASSPFVVAVGGTMFNENNNNAAYWNTANGPGITSAKSYIPENVWNESCPTCGLWAGSGGVSSFFPKPNWQFGVSGIPNDGARDLPDVSLTAAIHDPYLVCFQGQCFYAVGGTSASAPSFAGIMALIVQQYGRQGLANYILYRLASTETLSQCNGSNTTGLPNSTCIFNDTTKGNNAVPGEVGYGTSSAKFQAGVGYDLATGLGSVNVNNLVTKWNTVTFNATTTTITAPASISGAHGSPVSLDISVAPGSGTGAPTGDVSLQTGLSGNANSGFLTLSNGSISAPVNNLPGGSYTLRARYGGDSTYAPSTSSGVQVDITSENSTTAVSLFTFGVNGNAVPFTGGPFGGFVYPRADVAGTSGNGVPTGTVYFFDNGAFNFAQLSLNSAGNTAIPSGFRFFTPGPHTLTATYNGDSSFNSSNSTPVGFTITQASTGVTVNATPTGALQGNAISLTATIASSAFAGSPSGSIYPSGTATFWDGTTQIGSAQVFGYSQNQTGITALANFSTSSLALGSHSITVQYAGDMNYFASSSSAINVTIGADFTFSPTSSSVTVAQGGATTNTLTITGQTGYANTVNFTSASCAGLPRLTTCSFSPASVIGTSPTTVTIRTTAPSFAALHGVGLTAVGFVFAGVLLMSVPSRRFRSCAMLSAVLCVLVASFVACGGGSSQPPPPPPNPGTPKGTYNITVTATTSDQVVSHTTSFTLVVQ